MNKHILTTQEKTNLLKYKELINSINDPESVCLGIDLFYNEYKEYNCPVRSEWFYSSISLLDFQFRKLKNPRYYNDGSFSMIWYWLDRIRDLLYCGYYET